MRVETVLPKEPSSSQVDAAPTPRVVKAEPAYPNRFPAKVVWSGGPFFRSRRGQVLEFDEKNARVAMKSRPPRSSKARIRFEAPLSMTNLHDGIYCDFPAEMRDVRKYRDGYEATFQWDKPLSQMISAAAASRRKKIGILLVATIGVTLWLSRSSLTDFWYDPFLYFYSISLSVYFFSRFILSLAHRPPALKGYEPTVSIVISVRNEEKQIEWSVRSCWNADYPPEKREVIVVDDGSTDKTPEVLARLKQEIPNLKTFRIPPSGKRTAMVKGFREATGEIMVVIDSDSVLERTALHHIVCGFEDPTLGAVSGYTGVANADKNLLTRMQEIRYLVSFELMKSSESLFSCVTCCPGCLSAYRRTYLMKILDAWMNQTFMGVRATFGDDRSLTNYILRDYRVTYNPLARSTTFVPDNWRWYMNQQCRWKKSWLREAPIVARILLRKNPIAAISFYVSAVCSLFSPLIVFRFFWYREMFVPYVEGLLLLTVLTTVFALWKKPTKSWYATWYWIATQLIVMGPQTYWALLTVRKNHWGTR